MSGQPASSDPILDVLIGRLVDRLTPLLVNAVVHAMPAYATPLALASVEDMSSEELAKKLGISQVTISRLARAGMPHIWVGTQRRFALDECRTWFRERGRTVPNREPTTTRASNDAVAGVRIKSRVAR